LILTEGSSVKVHPGGNVTLSCVTLKMIQKLPGSLQMETKQNFETRTSVWR